jgi:hypothetical protein
MILPNVVSHGLSFVLLHLCPLPMVRTIAMGGFNDLLLPNDKQSGTEQQFPRGYMKIFVHQYKIVF